MTGWGETLREIIRLGAMHYFRRRPVAGLLISAAVALLLAAGSGWGIAFEHQDAGSRTSLQFTTGEGTPAWVSYLQAGLATLLLMRATAMVVAVARQDLRERQAAMAERDCRRVFVIEQRGLQSRLDSPLVEAVPAAVEGRRVPLVLAHGTMSAAGEADRGRLMDDAKQLRRDVRIAVGDTPPGFISIVYGGLAPVPITFLAGMVLDDEGAVTVMDWDRTAERWRALDGVDDGDRFISADLSGIRPETSEVMLAVSVSYGTDLDGVRAVADGNPVVALRVPSPRVGNHWSLEKQRALANEFLATIGRLQDMGITRIHLFLAAPNSVVFRFGKHYDRRNMPEVIVYQYEQSGACRFPWGIRMPRHGQPEPGLVNNDHYTPVI